MERGFATDASRLAALVQWTLETHGWKLLGALLLLYVARQRYRDFAARRHQERALAAANDPARVAVLQRETARVRRQQQQQQQSALGARQPKKAV